MKKFKIPVIPPTTNKCIRFPNDVIENVEKELVGTDCTFSAFVIEAVRVALENLQEEREGNSAKWKSSRNGSLFIIIYI